MAFKCFNACVLVQTFGEAMITGANVNTGQSAVFKNLVNSTQMLTGFSTDPYENMLLGQPYFTQYRMIH